MAAIYQSLDPASPSLRDRFPYRVELRTFRDMRRLWQMRQWLKSEAAEGAFTYYIVRGDHIDRGRYESRVFAFDHSGTAYRFAGVFEEDRW